MDLYVKFSGSFKSPIALAVKKSKLILGLVKFKIKLMVGLCPIRRTDSSSVSMNVSQ